ncbi:alkylhydroperoxidase domain protein [Corynebacterium confusum]|uniref:alkylhydroperoxidase domain protein n=1 Tax=Corynebacterium confusum TaxID=71254 RepID=UPI0025B50BB3|nr:alkylhydroperoxidase domain protein [Corynebacterium confusum]WJY90331.1 Carboxymuconolactone decarboxylase family protein [Corynebacterium confusum]
MTDIIDELAQTNTQVSQLRNARPAARENAQLSFEALLEPAEAGEFSQAERYAVAAFVAGITQAGCPAEFYLDLLGDEDEELLAPVKEAIEAGQHRGPYAGGGHSTFEGLGERLGAAFDFAHLLVFHPKDADPATIGHLDASGWGPTGMVSLAQLISFLAFQLRVVRGIAVLGGEAPAAPGAVVDTPQERPGWEVTGGVETPEVVHPGRFVNHALGWKPWVPGLSKEDFTEEQREALIKPERIEQPYFRLLARDPAALKARTLTDLDIFYNTDGGLGRAERELAATVVSRLNGCEYCASVHQQRYVDEGGDRETIDRLLDDGADIDLGRADWAAIRDAAVAISRTPLEFGAEHVDALQKAGLDDQAVLDVIYSSSFFNWANRLMLTLGTPDVPRRFR